jgi:16S rRNA (guanine527-N7)-methyltransferase
VSLLAPLRPRLEQGIEQLGLACNAAQVSNLLAYGELLLKWNKVYNLTAIRTPDEVVDLHLLDCLSLLPTLQSLLSNGVQTAAHVLDVGSGAGLPAAVICIALPEVHVTAIDSVDKKIAFQKQAAAQLQLSNWTALHTRIQDYQPESAPTVVTARAYSSLSDLVTTTQHLTSKVNGAQLQWLAMKGRFPETELTALSEHFPSIRIKQTLPLSLPGIQGERHLITLTPH